MGNVYRKMIPVIHLVGLASKMINKKVFLASCIAIACFSNLFGENKPVKKDKKIIIEVTSLPGQSSSTIDLKFIPAESIRYLGSNDVKVVKKEKGDFLKWVLHEGRPLLVFGSFLNKQYNFALLAEPGDSISIKYDNNEPAFGGHGSAKFEIAYRIDKLNDSLVKSTTFTSLAGRKYDPVNSIDDFISWNKALNIQLHAVLSLLDSYTSRISSYAYNVIRERELYKIEKIRLYKFNDLMSLARSNKAKLSNKDLCNIFDSTINGVGGKWMRYESPVMDDPYYLWYRVEFEMLRKEQRFIPDRASEALNGEKRIDRYVARYNWVKENYPPGKIREEVLAFFFHYVRGVIFSFGFEPKIEAILADYYSQPGYPEYKRAVKVYELERRAKEVSGKSIDFSFTDSKNKILTNNQLKGNIIVLDFWFTGCTGCVQMTPVLKKIEERFLKDTNVVFVSVSIDEERDLWLKSVELKKYTTGTAINVYTGGEGKNHPVIRNYGIEGYPALLILDASGKMVSRYPEYDPRKDNGKKLSALINEQLVLMKDGPYVMYDSGTTKAYAINGTLLTQAPLKRLNVQTDQPNSPFYVSLQKSLEIVPSEYAKPEKLFVLSDIEGNFEEFRKLLQANKIIDEHYNWIFGNGHLVFAGDMFDRGRQVTECLWLIYSLEEKARAAGGYVHFILGNHEIMNLQGDHRYVEAKYKNNAELMGKSLTQLYNEDTELGRWLRTKNVIEKIGDLLFLHGGISRKLNNMIFTIEGINDIARPNYANPKAQGSNDILIKTIFSAASSPFWYRSYYTANVEKQKEMENIIDSTMQKLNVSRIVTGHTIVSDTISVHYGGKVINTDTKHADGKSEALLIDQDKYYRVNAEGLKVLLFDDKQKR